MARATVNDAGGHASKNNTQLKTSTEIDREPVRARRCLRPVLSRSHASRTLVFRSNCLPSVARGIVVQEVGRIGTTTTGKRNRPCTVRLNLAEVFYRDGRKGEKEKRKVRYTFAKERNKYAEVNPFGAVAREVRYQLNDYSSETGLR